jgi:dihydroflavonol-4-reductase
MLNVVDVEDGAAGHVLALERGRTGHNYILGGENMTMRDVCTVLEELTGIPAPRVVLPARLIWVLGHIAEFIANHITHKTPIVDVESALHAMANRASDSGKAEKELGYAPSRARVAIAKAALWFVENGYCKERYRRRIEAQGGLRRAVAGR